MTWTDRCWIPLLDHAQGSCLQALSCRVTPICCRQHAKQGASTKQAGMHVSDPRTKLCASCQNARSCRAPADSVDSELDNGTPGKHPAAGSMLEEGPRPDVAPFYYRETRMWTRITPTVTRGWEADGVRSQGRDLGTGLGWGSLGSRRFPATSTEAAGFRSQRGSSRRHRGHAASFKPGRSFPPKISQTWHHHRFPSRRKLPR